MAVKAGPAVFAVSAMAALVLLQAGCSRTAPVAAAERPARRPAANERAAGHPLDNVGKVNGRGWYLPWYKRDPRRPNGPPIPVLIAEAETGEITRRNGTPEVVMRDVHARLFQKGVHAANVVAGKVRANQQEARVYASGGCTVTSLLNPADTVLTADRITWDTNGAIFSAEGHATVMRRPRDGGVPITHEGGKIVYDLERNTFTIL